MMTQTTKKRRRTGDEFTREFMEDDIDLLCDAILRGDAVQVQSLLQADSQLLMAKNELGRFPLYLAAGRGKTKMVKLLLDLGAPVDQRTPSGCTALWTAANNGHLSVVKLLVERYDANTQLRGKHGDGIRYTPLEVAREFHRSSVVKFFKMREQRMTVTSNEPHRVQDDDATNSIIAEETEQAPQVDKIDDSMTVVELERKRVLLDVREERLKKREKDLLVLEESQQKAFDRFEQLKVEHEKALERVKELERLLREREV